MTKKNYGRYVSYINTSWPYKIVKKASELGEVIIALTSDESILEHKGYTQN